MSEHAVDAVVGEDGSVHLDPDQLAPLGVQPGDNVRVLPVSKRKIRSRLGAHARAVGFTDEHLRDLRRDMSEGLGEDLRR